MCLKNTGSKIVSQSEQSGVHKHYERFGKWKHGLQRHLNKGKKCRKEG